MFNKFATSYRISGFWFNPGNFSESHFNCGVDNMDLTSNIQPQTPQHSIARVGYRIMLILIENYGLVNF